MRSSKQLVYVAEGVSGIFRSQRVCKDLGVIGQSFPTIGEHKEDSVQEKQQGKVVPEGFKQCLLKEECWGVNAEREAALPAVEPGREIPLKLEKSEESRFVMKNDQELMLPP